MMSATAAMPTTVSTTVSAAAMVPTVAMMSVVVPVMMMSVIMVPIPIVIIVLIVEPHSVVESWAYPNNLFSIIIVVISLIDFHSDADLCNFFRCNIAVTH